MTKRFPFVALATLSAFGTMTVGVPAYGKATRPARLTRNADQLRPVAGPAISDPVTRFTLDNGLTVIVQTSKRVPLITATVVYNVGSKDEKPGQYGYAHLFEHLMLDGSAHWNQNAFVSLRDLGATNVNASTNQDVTTLFETVPSAALERVLFLEADRMGYVGAALTPERVRREVGVVLNEKRQRAGRPDGTDDAVALADIYPEDHPYHHSVIGEDADLQAVTVDIARQWFDASYGPSNATLILAGDVTAEQAKRLVPKYFGGLAPRQPLDRLLTRTAPMTGPVRREIFRSVPQGRIYATYVAPPQGSPAIAALDLTAQIMAASARSRINRRLIEELGIARTAFVTFNEGRLSSRMGVVVDGIPPDQIARAEAEIDAVIATYVTEGPTPDELERARAARMQYLFGLQGSTSSKAFLLARGVGQVDDANYAETYLRQLRTATPESVRREAAAVYGAPGYRLIVRPRPVARAATTTQGGYDLAKGPPPLGPLAAITFPAVERARLANGLQVVLVRRPGALTDSALLRFDGAGLAGASREIAQLALDLFAAKATTAGQRERAEQAERLNGWLTDTVDQDHADLGFGWDATRPQAGISLLGQVLTRPGITPENVAALKKAGIEQAIAQGQNSYALADHALSQAVYGAGHPYASPAAADRIRAMQAVNAGAVDDWVRAHLRPDRATLYVAANKDMATLRPLLEKALAGWTAQGAAAPVTAIPPAHGTATPSLTVIDKPGAAQTYIMAGKVIPAAERPDGADATAAWAINEIYGGNPTARIGSNLRVDKGWTYGIGSGLYDTRGQRRWILAGPVSADHSGEAVAELIREMRDLGGAHPPEQRELTRIATSAANQSAARLENDADLLRAMADAGSEGLPHDDVVREPARLQALTLDDVRRAAGLLSDADTVHWVVVGDWQRIRDQFADLALGTPRVISPER